MSLNLQFQDSDFLNPILAAQKVRKLAEYVDSLKPGRVGSAVLYPQTPAETAASVIPTFLNYEEGDLRRYGAVLDGTTDDRDAVDTAILVAKQAGSMGRVFNPGSCALDSANFPVLVDGSGIEFTGTSSDTSRYIATGTGTERMFRVVSCSDISYRRIGFYGNNQADNYVKGWAIGFEQNSTTNDMENLFVEDCYFDNFKGDYWVCLWVNSGTKAIRNARVCRNRFVSRSGNNRGPTNISISSSCVGVIGSLSSSGGTIKNVWVEENYAECTYIKNFLSTWANTDRVFSRRNVVLNAGNSIGNSYGSYAFLAYDQSGGTYPPGEIRVEDNHIFTPRDCGMYGVNVQKLHYERNTCTGQINSDNSAIPKGACAFNGCASAVARGNRIDDCQIGIDVVGKVGGEVIIEGNSFLSMKSSATCLWLSGATGGQAEVYRVRENLFRSSAAGHAIYAFLSGSAGVKLLEIDENEFLETPRGIYLDQSGGFLCDQANVRRNTFRGQTVLGAYMGSLTGTTILTEDNHFLGGWGSSVTLLWISGSTKTITRGNTFANMTSGSGVCLATAGAQGSLVDNRFFNVSSAYRISATGSEDLGLDAPTWSGVLGDEVQNLLAAASGSFVKEGWRHDGTAWRERLIAKDVISGGGGSGGSHRYIVDADYTLVLGDNGNDIRIGGITANRTLYIPENASVAFPAPNTGIGTDQLTSNTVINVLWYASGTTSTLTFMPQGATTLRVPNGSSSTTYSNPSGYTTPAGSTGVYWYRLVKVATDTWYLFPAG